MNELSRTWAHQHKLYLAWLRDPEHYRAMLERRLPAWLRGHNTLQQKALLTDVREIREAHYKHQLAKKREILPGVL